MNKRKFLKALEQKLIILSDSEKEDILNEYRDIIEEKVKHGKTEEEAVKEFGSIEELSKEILSAYKINPEYQEKSVDQKEKKDKKEFVETTEDFIKKSAKKLSEVTEDVVESFKESNVEFTTEKIFEIIIKVLLVLLGLALLKLPFYLVGELGANIFNIGFAPFSWISEFAWKILIEVIYLIACALVLFTVISKYVKPKSKSEKKSVKEVSSIEESQTSKKKVKNETHQSVLLILLKGFACLVFLFPLWCINFGLLMAIACIVYLLWQGLNVVGALILLLGLLFIGVEFCKIIYSFIFTKKHYHLSSFVIGFIMILLGSFLTLDYISDFTYYDDLPEKLFHQGTITYDETISTPIKIDADRVEIIIDSNLEDSQIKIEASYYKDYITIHKDRHEHDQYSHIYFEISRSKSSFNWKRDIKEQLLKHLEKKEIYNYSLLDDIYVKVYVNEATKDLIQ